MIPRRFPLYALFLLSGATSLVYEVLWLRELILIFGSTVHATSTTLATFMAGLALGAWGAGRSPRLARLSPLAAYGRLELAIGAYALAVPVLLSAVSPIIGWAWRAGGEGSGLLLDLVKFACIAAVLLPPTALMGATLPVLSRAVASDPDRIGGQVGALYAVNTAGAVAGTFVAGFVAIPGLGMRATLLATAAVSVSLGLVAIRLGRTSAAPPPLPAEAPARGDRSALAAFALSGFVAMALEVAWTRALALVVGSSVYAFSLMLVAFLAGLAGGGAAFSALLRRTAVRPRALLVALLASAGILAWASSFLFIHLPRLFAEAHYRWELPPSGWFAVQFALCLLVMFPATFTLGGIFPAVLQLRARGLEGVASSVGGVYAANTAGTILGAVVGGFVLVPRLGVVASVVWLAALELAAAAAVALLSRERALRLRAAVPLAVLALLPWVRPGWDVLLMNSGVYVNLGDIPASRGWSGFLDYAVHEIRLLYAKDGLSASVVVGEQSDGNRYLAVNGKVDASNREDLETQLLIGHLPLLLHRDPRDVMVIGLASGITAGAAAAHPVSSLRIVEIEASMVEAARLFAPWNGNVLADPRVLLSINDARNELEFSDRRYDAILSEPSNPWMTVASNLFTRDFFLLARQRLNPGGIFCQWVQTYGLHPRELRSILASFRSAFPHVQVFRAMGGVDVLLLGTREPLLLDLPAVEERLSELRVRLDLARIGVESATDLLPYFVVGDRQVAALAEGAPLNTDDNARVEFAAPRTLREDTVAANVALLLSAGSDPLDYVVPRPGGQEARDALRLELVRGLIRRGHRKEARGHLERIASPVHREEAHRLLGEIGTGPAEHPDV